MPPHLKQNVLLWELVEQPSNGRSRLPICARCNDCIEPGSLRIRPHGTHRTRTLHLKCSHGLCSWETIVDNHNITGPMLQRVQRVFGIVAIQFVAPGDVFMRNIADAMNEGIVPTAPFSYTLTSLGNFEFYEFVSAKDRTCAGALEILVC